VPPPRQGYALAHMELGSSLAHGGHAIYDHPALAAVFILALVIPWTVLILVGRWFIRQRDEDERRRR
jgi:hypothetical protein